MGALELSKVSLTSRMKQYFSSLWQPVNNSPLIVFRILFGLVMAGECIYGITSGLVKFLYIDIAYNFTFIGFEWLNVLHGKGMYVYFFVMALSDLFLAAGLLYRFSSLLLSLMWTAVYLSQKTYYNNHYYLLLLLCWIMACMPAHRRFSADVKLKLVRPCNECYRWQIHLFIFQMAVVYVFAAIAKLNPDWLHAVPLKTWLAHKKGLRIIGRFMNNPVLPWLVAYCGLLFDLLVVPGLLYKGTRKYFFVLLIMFHAFNGYVFRIGSFPFLAISLGVFFFPSAFFNRFIALSTQAQPLQPWNNIKGGKFYVYVISAYAAIQLLLPARHWFIPGAVDWTEEGHRMAWRMMLRSKTGTASFKVVNTKNDSTWFISPSAFVHKSQVNEVVGLPDVTWQAAQYLKEKYKAQGMNVSVYAFNKAEFNFHPSRLLIDTACNLADTKWDSWGHNKWILLYKD